MALELANASRKSAQRAAAARQRAARRLPLHRRQVKEGPEPEAVSTWLKDFELLRGLPFGYLVPDERLWRVEGLRFFQLDTAWVECLLDGARSMGRLTEADRQHARGLRAQRGLGHAPKVSGFVMRSSVVSGYPKLLIEAYKTQAKALELIDPKEVLEPLRIERLADDVLLGLFRGDGEIKTLDVFQAPEGMNFGLDRPDSAEAGFTKNLRGSDGGSLETCISPIPWSDEHKGVINIAQLAERMKSELKLNPFTAAQLACQMIEGVPRIRYVAGG